MTYDPFQEDDSVYNTQKSDLTSHQLQMLHPLWLELLRPLWLERIPWSYPGAVVPKKILLHLDVTSYSYASLTSSNYQLFGRQNWVSEWLHHPFEKYARPSHWIIFPKNGMKRKALWNHHLVGWEYVMMKNLHT